MVQNPHAPPPRTCRSAVTAPMEPFNAFPDTKRNRAPPQLVGGWPLPIVVALGVGAVMLMIFAALMTVWLLS
jgi:hypothetical protein